MGYRGGWGVIYSQVGCRGGIVETREVQKMGGGEAVNWRGEGWGSEVLRLKNSDADAIDHHDQVNWIHDQVNWTSPE